MQKSILPLYMWNLRKCLRLSINTIVVDETTKFILRISLDPTSTVYDSSMGYNEIIRKSGNQNYPQNMIHTFDTEHLCQAQCHVPCSMKHISDLMMQRWLCPLKVNFLHFSSFISCLASEYTQLLAKAIW